MGGVQRLQHIGDGVAAGLDAEALGGLGNARRFVAQRLHQPQHAVGARRRAHQHRADQALAQFAGEIVEHLVARRLDVFEQLLHQLVVVIGERLQHGEARGLFQIGDVAFERNDFRGRVLLVDKGALEREIDEARDDVAGEGRDLAQDQLGARRRLQQLEHVVDAGIGLVDLVDEQDARDFLVFELAQDELELRDLLLVHLADHDGGVDRRQHRAHVVDEFDRARAIEERVGVAHEIRGGGGELDAHAVMARFLAGVADRVAGFDGALALDRAGAGEDRFEQRGLAALERADQRDAAWTGRSSAIAAVRCHGHLPRLPLVPARPPETHRFRRRRGWSRGATLRTAPRRTAIYWARCSSSELTPAAILSPVWPCTESGCSATERFEPPTSTLAPSPAAIDISADAPT